MLCGTAGRLRVLVYKALLDALWRSTTSCVGLLGGFAEKPEIATGRGLSRPQCLLPSDCSAAFRLSCNLPPVLSRAHIADALVVTHVRDR